MSEEKTVAKLAGTKFLSTATLNMLIPGTAEPSGWKWTVAGPAHEITVALNDKAARKTNKKNADMERAQVNGNKWKGEAAKDPEDIRLENVTDMAARVLDWTPVDFGDGEIEYSKQAVIDFLMNRANGAFFAQYVDFLNGEKSFLKASASG